MYGMFSDVSECDWLLLLLLVVLLLGGLLSGLLALGRVGGASLLARPLAEPLGQPRLGPLGPLGVLVLPHLLDQLGAQHLGAALVQLLPLAVGSGVRPPLVLGEHVDGGRVRAAEGLGVQTLLDGFVPHLQFLSLLQFLHLVVLVQLSLLIVIFVSLQSDDAFPYPRGLVLELI